MHFDEASAIFYDMKKRIWVKTIDQFVYIFEPYKIPCADLRYHIHKQGIDRSVCCWIQMNVDVRFEDFPQRTTWEQNPVAVVITVTGI